MTSGGEGRFGAPRQSVVNTCSSVRASRELHGTVPLSRLLSIVATSEAKEEKQKEKKCIKRVGSIHLQTN